MDSNRRVLLHARNPSQSRQEVKRCDSQSSSGELPIPQARNDPWQGPSSRTRTYTTPRRSLTTPRTQYFQPSSLWYAARRRLPSWPSPGRCRTTRPVCRFFFLGSFEPRSKYLEAIDNQHSAHEFRIRRSAQCASLRHSRPFQQLPSHLINGFYPVGRDLRRAQPPVFLCPILAGTLPALGVRGGLQSRNRLCREARAAVGVSNPGRRG